MGRLPSLAEFLDVAGLFTRWREGSPVAYANPSPPKGDDVLGTLAAVDSGAAALPASDEVVQHPWAMTFFMAGRPSSAYSRLLVSML